jgi:hypothetical protein
MIPVHRKKNVIGRQLLDLNNHSQRENGSCQQGQWRGVRSAEQGLLLAVDDADDDGGVAGSRGLVRVPVDIHAHTLKKSSPSFES